MWLYLLFMALLAAVVFLWALMAFLDDDHS